MRRAQPAAKRRTFHPKDGMKYLAFYKPYGVLTQFSLPEGSDKRTLAEFGMPAGVYPVGRLDYDSEGLLILSDDGSLNQFLLDPIHGHDRTYMAQVEHVPGPEQLHNLRTGVTIDQQTTAPAEAELFSGEPSFPSRRFRFAFARRSPRTWVKLTLREGKNRQVRRMTAAVGCPTLRLIRIAIGRLDVFHLALQPGEWRQLPPQLLSRLFEQADDKLEIPRVDH